MAKIWQRKPSLLLLENVPKPCHQLNPRSVLGDAWWDRERKLAYASTNYHCEACGIHKSKIKHLEGHEVYDIDYQKGRLTYVRTTPLCPKCHQYIHDGRLQMMLQQGQINRQHYTSVIQHGDSVLASDGLRKLNRNERDDKIRLSIISGRIAQWNDWRLIIDTRPYETLVLNQRTDKKVKGTVYIGRGSPWGNPFVIGEHGTRKEVCDRYEKEILPKLDLKPLFLKNLMCFCHPSRCHGHSIQAKLYAVRSFEPKFKSYEEWAAAHAIIPRQSSNFRSIKVQ